MRLRVRLSNPRTVLYSKKRLVFVIVIRAAHKERETDRETERRERKNEAALERERDRPTERIKGAIQHYREKMRDIER